MSICSRNMMFSERLYRLLLFLYPPHFRARFAPEMVRAWQVTHPLSIREGGRRKRLAFWLWTFTDLARSVPEEWRLAAMSICRPRLSLRALADSLIVPLIIIATHVLAGGIAGTVRVALGANVLQTGNAPAIAGFWNPQALFAAATAACFLSIASVLATLAVRHGGSTVTLELQPHESQKWVRLSPCVPGRVICLHRDIS